MSLISSQCLFCTFDCPVSLRCVDQKYRQHSLNRSAQRFCVVPGCCPLSCNPYSYWWHQTSSLWLQVHTDNSVKICSVITFLPLCWVLAEYGMNYFSLLALMLTCKLFTHLLSFVKFLWTFSLYQYSTIWTYLECRLHCICTSKGHWICIQVVPAPAFRKVPFLTFFIMRSDQ